MDQTAFNEIAKRLQEVDGLIKKLDPAIRADAFTLLKGYVTGGRAAEHSSTSTQKESKSTETKPEREGAELDVDALVEKHESDTDWENALLALAVYYARYGKGPFQMPALKGVADELRLTVPGRMDKFFKGHKRDGKEVLRKQADGWKVMPSGETWLKTTYGVTRGKDTPSDDDS